MRIPAIQISALAIALAPAPMGVERTPPASDFYFQAPRAPFAASQVLDLDGNGKPERISVDSRRAQVLGIARGGKILWRGVQRRVQPWCLRVGDGDGDGRPEIALGTFKSARLWPRAPHALVLLVGWKIGARAGWARASRCRFASFTRSAWAPARAMGGCKYLRRDSRRAHNRRIL